MAQASSQRIKATISTTTAFGKLRGFTLTVLDLLEEGLTSHQVAEITEKSNLYVNVYLFRLRKYGLASKNEGFWFLTEKGVQIRNLMKRYNNNNNRTITQQQHNHNTTITLDSRKRPIQLSLDNWSRKDSLTDCEQRVVEVLLDHYNKTRSKVITFKDQFELSESFGFNVDVVEVALQHLFQDHIVWPPRREPSLNCWKIGLYVEFLEGLQKCNGVGST